MRVQARTTLLAAAVVTVSVIIGLLLVPSLRGKPASLQAPGLKGITVNTLCLETKQSLKNWGHGTGGTTKTQPIAKAIHRLLAQQGVSVVEAGEPCDATLEFTLAGAIIHRGGYSPADIATVEGEMSLSVPGHAPLILPLDADNTDPGNSLPLDKTWLIVVLDGLTRLWGNQILVQALEDKDIDVRWAAIEVVDKTGPEEWMISPLVHAMEQDKSSEIRKGIIGVLRRSGPELKQARLEKRVIPALIRAMRDEDADIRRSAAAALAFVDPQATSTFIRLMGKREANVREAATWGLAMLGPDAVEAVPALIQALKDREPTVRAGSAVALRRIGPGAKQAVPALTNALEDNDGDVRSAAASALYYIGPDEESVPNLIQTLRDEEQPWARSSAARMLGGLGHGAAEAVPALIDALEKDEDFQAREQSALALGRIGAEPAEAIPALVQALENDQVRYVREAAAEALGMFELEALDTVPVLIRALENDDSRVRYKAQFALSSITGFSVNDDPDVWANRWARISSVTKTLRDKELSPFDLVPMLNSADMDVRQDAIWALGYIGPQSAHATPHLVSALRQEEDKEARCLAIWALARIGPQAVPALAKTLYSEDSWAQAGAVLALYYMGPEAMESVPHLIATMEPAGGSLNLRRSYYDALREITGQDFEYDLAAWQAWWEQQQ
jgi:HEAT repeat protein